MASIPQTTTSARQDLYRRMDKHNTAPLWEVLHGVLFSFSDRPGQDAMGLWRERRG